MNAAWNGRFLWLKLYASLSVDVASKAFVRERFEQASVPIVQLVCAGPVPQSVSAQTIEAVIRDECPSAVLSKCASGVSVMIALPMAELPALLSIPSLVPGTRLCVRRAGSRAKLGLGIEMPMPAADPKISEMCLGPSNAGCSGPPGQPERVPVLSLPVPCQAASADAPLCAAVPPGLPQSAAAPVFSWRKTVKARRSLPRPGRAVVASGAEEEVESVYPMDLPTLVAHWRRIVMENGPPPVRNCGRQSSSSCDPGGEL